MFAERQLVEDGAACIGVADAGVCDAANRRDDFVLVLPFDFPVRALLFAEAGKRCHATQKCGAKLLIYVTVQHQKAERRQHSPAFGATVALFTARKAQCAMDDSLRRIAFAIDQQPVGLRRAQVFETRKIGGNRAGCLELLDFRENRLAGQATVAASDLRCAETTVGAHRGPKAREIGIELVSLDLDPRRVLSTFFSILNRIGKLSE